MGCQYSKNTNDKFLNVESLLSNQDNNPISSLNLSDYTKAMFRLINKIRANPSEFADIIEKSIQYIKQEENKLIFSYKLKVALTKGEEVFKQVAEELRSLTSLAPFEFKDEIVLEVPNDENELKDIKVFMNKVITAKKTNNNNLDAYFKDAIKEPEIAILMIIVDDTEKNPGKKRAAVLNKDYKYIGISSVYVGKTFCAYYTFSK